MMKNEKGEWFFFNREYVPIGWNSTAQNDFKRNEFVDLPVYTKYTRITDAMLIILARDGEDSIRRNEEGEIIKVFFYNDTTNPQNDPKYWPDYFEKIKLLSRCNVKRT
jgi:hypothetical protein